MIKIILIVLAVIYMIYASENGAFPFAKKAATTLPSKKLEDYSLGELREAYYKKLLNSVAMPAELIELEKQFQKLIKKTDSLVRTEYPACKWRFLQKNVGASIVLNSQIEVMIFTYDGQKEKRVVLIKNHEAYELEPIYNAASPIDMPSPNEVLFGKETSTEKIADEKEQEEEIETIETYTDKWFEENFEYLMELKESGMKSENGIVLIPKNRYKKESAQLICSILVEKWGYEASFENSEGIQASMYVEE